MDYFFMKKVVVEAPKIDQSCSTHYWDVSLSRKWSQHKVGRLKREVKKHSQNCWKRQHALIKLQELFAYESNKKFLITETRIS